MEQKYSDEQLKEAIRSGKTMTDIAEEFGVTERCVYRRKAKLLRKGWSPEHDLTHEIPDGYKLKGTSTLYDRTGQVTAQWVKTAEDKETQMQLCRDAIVAMISDLPKLDPAVAPESSFDDLLAVYPLGDPHIGMLAWEAESGENWDLQIAENTFITLFDRVVKSAPPCKQAVIVNLGDFFHYDNLEGKTSRSGHSLDRDGRYAKMVQVGVKILRQMIQSALVHHENVTVINCIGNHDDVGAIFLSVCLKHVYENEPRVTIDDSPSPFHYVRFGKVLLGMHHGHTCKKEKLASVMASDRARDWGDTQYRYWLTGHIHHDSKQEYPGCMVESFRTLAAKDAYATYGGWRSGRSTQAIIYNKNFGEVERHIIDIAQGDFN